METSIYQLGNSVLLFTILFALLDLYRQMHKNRTEIKRLAAVVGELSMTPAGQQPKDLVEKTYEMVKPFYDSGHLDEVKRIASNNLEEPSQFKKLYEMLKASGNQKE